MGYTEIYGSDIVQSIPWDPTKDENAPVSTVEVSRLAQNFVEEKIQTEEFIIEEITLEMFPFDPRFWYYSLAFYPKEDQGVCARSRSFIIHVYTNGQIVAPKGFPNPQREDSEPHGYTTRD